MKNFLPLAVMSVSSVCSAQTVGFHIGNSLTWDSQPAFLVDIAQSQGITLLAGYHINCNRSLDQIIANPTQTCIDTVPGFGYFEEALPLPSLTYATMQPFWTPTSTLATDIASIQTFSSLLGADKKVFIYQGWGSKSVMSNGSWTDSVVNSGSTQTIPKDEYFTHLISSISPIIPQDVYIIPAGSVIYALNEAINLGQIHGVSTIDELYRDNIHMSYGIGRFAAAITVATCVLDLPPFTFHEEWISEFGDRGYEDQTYIDIANVVWDVVSTDGRATINECLADINRDGEIGPPDFSSWIGAYNMGHSIADQNRDGSIMPNDFSAWISNYNSGCVSK